MENEFESGVSEELAGQPVETSEGASDETSEQSLSDKINALKSEFRTELDAREQKLLREIQSGIDKADRRITDRLRTEFQELDRSVEALRAEGVEITDTQLETLKQRRMLREFGGELGQGEGSTEGPAQGKPDGQALPADAAKNPVVAEAYQMMADAGVTIEENDPEASILDLKTKSIKKFLDSVDAAIKAKQLRLKPDASEGDETPEEELSDTESRAANAAARNPGTGVKKGAVASGSPSGLSGFEHLKRHYSKNKP